MMRGKESVKHQAAHHTEKEISFLVPLSANTGWEEVHRPHFNDARELSGESDNDDDVPLSP